MISPYQHRNRTLLLCRRPDHWQHPYHMVADIDSREYRINLVKGWGRTFAQRQSLGGQCGSGHSQAARRTWRTDWARTTTRMHYDVTPQCGVRMYRFRWLKNFKKSKPSTGIDGSFTLYVSIFFLLGFGWDGHQRPWICWDGSQPFGPASEQLGSWGSGAPKTFTNEGFGSHGPWTVKRPIEWRLVQSFINWSNNTSMNQCRC